MSQIDGPESAGTARYLQADPVRAYISAVFAAKGMPAADAAVAAEALVRADLRGVWSHGVARVPMYCDRLDHGAAKADPAIKVERVAPAAALVDGDDGLGLVVARRAMAEAIALAEGSGIGLAGTRRSGHFGMAGLYALQAVEAGCIGMVFTNASRALPPFGAAEPFFGTSPRRCATRSTWVSTGRAGRPRAKSSTHAAVFGPTPGNDRSHAFASSSGSSASSLRS